MKINDIQYIPRIQNFQLIAGKEGISRNIRNVVIFEYEDEKNYEDNYYDEDFIITSLIFAKNNPSLIEPMLKKMMELGASGIAIKRAYYQELPENVLAFANLHELPIFVFDDIYIEDVIVSIADYMQKEKRYSLYQQEILELITENRSPYEIEKYCRLMNNAYSGCMTGAYLECSESKSSQAVDQILHSLLMRRKIKTLKDYQFYQYHNGMFILYNHLNPLNSSSYYHKFTVFIEQFGCRMQDFVVGFSSCLMKRQDIDKCFRESFFACKHAKAAGLSFEHYENIGTDKLIYPLLLDKSCQKEYQYLMQLLSSSDVETGSDLLETIYAYCSCGHNIKQTAEMLFQHPNTIRYRLKRAMELMRSCNQQDFLLQCILLTAYHKQPF